MEIRSLASINMEELFIAWTEAFKGYARAWARPELESMLRRRGYMPDLSFGAFDQERLVSFTLNAAGPFNSRFTAYDTGTATIPSYRGQGLATRVFRHALPYLQEAGVEQYLLEVIQDNENAITIYKNIGFEITRELDYFIAGMKELCKAMDMPMPGGIAIRETDLSFRHIMEGMPDFSLSWQNSFESIARSSGGIKIAGAFHHDRLVGYGMIEPMSGDIPQLAVDPKFRRAKIGSTLLAWLLRYNLNDTVRIINIERGYKGIYAFLEHSGIKRKGAQYEMVLPV